MNLKRFIIQIGTGVDLHGQDVTKAARRAVEDAISKNCLVGLVEALQLRNLEDLNEAMVVEVTIASPYPEKVKGEQVLDAIPIGKKHIKVVEGGMLAPGLCVKEFGESDTIVVANASVVVLVDMDRIKTIKEEIKNEGDQEWPQK